MIRLRCVRLINLCALVVMTSLFIVLIFLRPPRRVIQYVRTISSKRQLEGERKLILLLNGTTPEDIWGVLPRVKPERAALSCPFTKCVFTHDISLFTQCDAVVFDVNSVKFKDPPLHLRRPGQIWIFYSRSSPAAGHRLPSNWRHVFDWSMTYHSKSDIHMPHGRMLPLGGLQRRYNFTNVSMEHRRLAAAWSPPNCSIHSNGHRFVTELKNYIRVDIIGKCGTTGMSCSRFNTTDKCFQWMTSKYKFIILFEASYCHEYIPANIYKILETNAVPVIRGLWDYQLLPSPHKPVVNADNLSPLALGKYLKKLYRNSTMYAEHLKWKVKYSIQSTQNRDISWCELADRLHDPSRYQPRGNPYDFWYFGNHCKT